MNICTILYAASVTSRHSVRASSSSRYHLIPHHAAPSSHHAPRDGRAHSRAYQLTRRAHNPIGSCTRGRRIDSGPQSAIVDGDHLLKVFSATRAAYEEGASAACWPPLPLVLLLPLSPLLLPPPLPLTPFFDEGGDGWSGGGASASPSAPRSPAARPRPPRPAAHRVSPSSIRRRRKSAARWWRRRRPPRRVLVARRGKRRINRCSGGRLEAGSPLETASSSSQWGIISVEARRIVRILGWSPLTSTTTASATRTACAARRISRCILPAAIRLHRPSARATPLWPSRLGEMSCLAPLLNAREPTLPGSCCLLQAR